MIEFEPRVSSPEHDIVLQSSMIAYDERPLGISEDVHGWKVPHATENFLFWRDVL